MEIKSRKTTEQNFNRSDRIGGGWDGGRSSGDGEDQKESDIWGR